jgi:DNA-directed RNA polymerase sigma subunit (sigma70/sigma32)
MVEQPRRFVTELSDALRLGMEQGRLTDDDLDPLLHSPDFDPGAFDLFIAEARRQGIHMPEEARAEEIPPSEESGRSLGSLERRYMKEIQRYPILERDTERALWDGMRHGVDLIERETARRKLILAYLRLVVSIARA